MRSLSAMLPKNFAQAVWRLAGVLATIALVWSIAFGGARYFFCAGMDRIHGEDACCAPFEASVEDILRAEREAEHQAVSVGELETPCCEARHFAVLPGGALGAVSPPLEAPWVGVTVLPSATPLALALARMSGANLHARPERYDTGPPPESAHAACARRSVYIL